MNLKTTAAAVYATLQALHDAVSEIDPTSGNASAGAEQGVVDALTAHHNALNEVRKLFADWPAFLAFIGQEPEAAKSGGTPKD